MLVGQARACEGGIERNFERGDDDGGGADHIGVIGQVGGGELVIRAGIDGNEIGADGIEQDDADACGMSFRVENFFAMDIFANCNMATKSAAKESRPTLPRNQVSAPRRAAATAALEPLPPKVV